MFIPQWLVKPNYKKPLTITNKGWVDKETGELIVSVRDLDKKIKDLSDALKAIDCECDFYMGAKEEVKTEEPQKIESVVEDKSEQPQKRKAGRPPRIQK